MGFFFRRSTSFGPFRLNFSKSGIGASVGVPGARLTVTPRGTMYVTAGSDGFYYREMITRPPGVSTDQSFRPTPNPAPLEDAIVTADVTTLVDSSAAELIQRLNERAEMFNFAWLLYCAGAVLLILGISLYARGTDPSKCLLYRKP